jgi:hypothetical protein
VGKIVHESINQNKSMKIYPKSVWVCSSVVEELPNMYQDLICSTMNQKRKTNERKENVYNVIDNF